MSHYADLIRHQIYVWVFYNGRTDKKCVGRMQNVRRQQCRVFTLNNIYEYNYHIHCLMSECLQWVVRVAQHLLMS